MRSTIRLVLGAASMVIALGPEAARAAPSFSTAYSYYSVSGTTATGIYASLLRWQINRSRHFASTSISIGKPGTASSAKGCRVDHLPVKFLIRLPKHSNEASLPANDRRLWQQFSSFVRKHEETHRAIWMGCARSLYARVAGFHARSCDAAVKNAKRVFEQTRGTCLKKDAAFDAAERRHFDSHPFIRAAEAPIYRPIKTRPTKLVAKKRKRSVSLPN